MPARAILGVALTLVIGLTAASCGVPANGPELVVALDEAAFRADRVTPRLAPPDAKALAEDLRIRLKGRGLPSEVSVGVDGKIVIRFRNATDLQRFKSATAARHSLRFREVDEEADPSNPFARAGQDRLTDGRYEALWVKRTAVLTGAMIRDAHMTYDGASGQPAISFTFNTEGARRFGAWTTAHVDKRLAIVFDGRLISAPRITGPILGGSGQISGTFTPAEARELASIIATQGYPLVIVDEQTAAKP